MCFYKQRNKIYWLYYYVRWGQCGCCHSTIIYLFSSQRINHLCFSNRGETKVKIKKQNKPNEINTQYFGSAVNMESVENNR